MKAMIFAAGKGIRLKPVTDKIPKALVRINGITLLEQLILKLIDAGVNEIIINVHHFASQIISFIREKKQFGINVSFSEENLLLDTGGGLKKAAWFFKSTEPFIIHNVDILSDIDLKKMYNFHLQSDVLATLAVKQRQTLRYLLFDSNNLLAGRQIGEKIILSQPGTESKKFDKISFLGIHIVSPALFEYFPEEKVFSILDVYLRAAKNGASVKAYQPDFEYWYDLGKPDTLQTAQEYFSSQKKTKEHQKRGLDD